MSSPYRIVDPRLSSPRVSRTMHRKFSPPHASSPRGSTKPKVTGSGPVDPSSNSLILGFNAKSMLDLRSSSCQKKLMQYNAEENERLAREAFDRGGGFSLSERILEKMQRILQRMGKDANRKTDTNEALRSVYSLNDLYKLSMSDEVVSFATREIDWLEGQLQVMHRESFVQRTVRTPEFFEADSQAFSWSRNLDHAGKDCAFHKVYCVVPDVVKVVEAMEVLCARWNKPHTRVLFVEDFLVTEQDFSKRLKVRATVEFMGITWKLHFTTQDIWKLDQEGGHSVRKTIDFIQLQFLSASITNKPEKLQHLMEYTAVKAVADPNAARDASGLSGLHHAALLGSMEIIQVLLSAHADPWLQDNNGRPPLYYACRFGRTEVADYLMSLMSSEKDSDANLTAICSCLEFEWDDQCPLIPSVVKIKRHIKARYIELIAEHRFAEFCQLAKFTKVAIEDPAVMRMMLPRDTATAGALLQALIPDAIVDLSHLKLTGQTVIELADALRAETPIGQLKFSGNKDLGLKPDAGIGVARLVSMAPQLRVLVLEDCGFTPDAFHCLVTRLDQRGALQRISFKKNRFMGCETISGVGFHSILRIRSLRQLDFSLCGWYSCASEALCKRLQSFFFLRWLKLDNNPYIGTDPMFGETVAKILIYARALDLLSISGCDISSEVITVMGAKLSEYPEASPQVRFIDFQKNTRLGDSPDAGHGLAVLLNQCECITSLNLSYVGMTPATLLNFGKSLHNMRLEYSARQQGERCRECSIASMDFGNNYKLGTSPESGVGIAYLLINCSQLLDFNLTGCHLSPEAMQKLGESLDRPISVRTMLWPGNWHIGSAPEGGRGLGLLLQQAPSLHEMDFTQCGLTSESLAAIGNAINQTIDLNKITIDGNNEVGMKRVGGLGLGKLLLHARSLERFKFTRCAVKSEFVEGLRDALAIKEEQPPPIISCKFITMQTMHTSGVLSATAMGEMLANLLMAARFLHSCELERCQLDSVTLAKLGASISRDIAMKKITFAKNDAIGAFASGGTGIGQLLSKAVHLEEVSLKQTGFSPQATEALGAALSKNVLSLKLMDLSNNPRLGSASGAGRGIANILKSCPQLDLLNLTCCNFGSDGINRCSALVADEWAPLGVKRLNFQGNSQLGQLLDGGAALGTFLSAAYNLEWLNLSRCGLNSVAILAMVNHAHTFNALTFLDISESYVATSTTKRATPRKESSVPGGKPIGQFVNLGSRIKILRVSECGITADEMLQLGKVLKPNELEDVDLSGNELGDAAEGGQGLGLFLQRSPKLQKLNLKHCGICFEAIEAMLNTRGFKEMPELTTLLLASNPLGGRKESGTLLGELLGKCPKLSVLEVRNCGLTSAALGNLGPAISRRGGDYVRGDRERAKLRIVDLAYNANLGDSGALGKGLAGLVNSLPTIYEINLTCCGLTAAALSGLLENLNDHRSKTIKKMLFSGNTGLGKSPESGRILFQLLLKFRVAYIDCSSCGITSEAMECLGSAVDSWRARISKGKEPEKPDSKTQSSGTQPGMRNMASIYSARTFGTSSRSPSETGTGTYFALGNSRASLGTSRSQNIQTSVPSVSGLGTRLSSSRFVRSVMLEPKLYTILQEFDLSNNPDMLTTEKAGQSMGKLLTFAEIIELVKLSNCGITGEAIYSMAEYVEQMHILNLDLSRNPSIAKDQIGGDGLQTIFSNPKIEEVDLSDCRVPIKFSPTIC